MGRKNKRKNKHRYWHSYNTSYDYNNYKPVVVSHEEVNQVAYKVFGSLLSTNFKTIQNPSKVSQIQ